MNFADEEIVCFTEKCKNKDNVWKAFLSDSTVYHTVKYCYLLLNHPGKHRLLHGMNRYCHPNLGKISTICSVRLAKNIKYMVETLNICQLKV